MSDPQSGLREWLRGELSKRPRGTKGRLAQHIGVRADAITRMLNTDPKKETREIRAHELVKMREFFDQGEQSRTLNIVGRVGAGEEVFAFDDEAMGGGDPIEAPPDIGPNAIAVRVQGRSMYPELDPDDVLVYDERYASDFEHFIGRRVVVGLPDGRRFVKRLHKGSAPGLWRLSSVNPTVEDMEVPLEWVAPIKWAKMG